MNKLIVFALLVTLAYAHTESGLDPQNSKDIEAFRHELHQKYEEAKGSGQEGKTFSESNYCESNKLDVQASSDS